MTNLQIGICLGSVLTSCSASLGFYLLHKKISAGVARLEQFISGGRTAAASFEQTVLQKLDGEVDSLKVHSLSLRDHAKNIHDVARATSAPRTVPTR